MRNTQRNKEAAVARAKKRRYRYGRKDVLLVQELSNFFDTTLTSYRRPPATLGYDILPNEKVDDKPKGPVMCVIRKKKSRKLDIAGKVVR